MDDRSRVLAAGAVGAVGGALWGWLYLTSRGAELREQSLVRLGEVLRKSM